MSALAAIYRRFVASARGVASIEFAMIVPVLLLLLLASIDAGRAIAVYMKVRSATYALDAITNQYKQIQDVDMQQILGATSVVLAPYSSSPASVVISQLSVTPSGVATVKWSDALNGAPRTVGSSVTIPTGLVAPGQTQTTYLIFGEVSYRYTPLFGYFITGALTLADSLYSTPRNMTTAGYACITRTSTPNSCP